jgi:tetratricopeptide (TPR) repeat protein
MADSDHSDSKPATDAGETLDPAKLVAEAEELRLLGRISEADALFKRVLTAKPGHVDANLGAGRCAWAEANHSTALIFFTAAARHGKYLWPLLHFGMECRKAGNIELAESAYRRAAEFMPQRAEPYLGLAACARRRGDKAMAAELQAQGSTRAPDDLLARVDLARDLQELQRLEEAAQILDDVLSRDPTLQPALKLAAVVARDRGNTDRALQLLRQVEENEPEAVGPIIERIALHRERGEKQQALELGQHLLERDPGNVAALLQLGLLHRASDDTPAALESFERAYAREPANVALILQLARELRTAGQQQRSDELLELALQLDTKGTQALAYRAEQALMANDAEAALAAYETGIERAPAQLHLYLGASNALARMGRMTDALALLDQAAKRCEPSAALFARRSNLLRQAGRLLDALKIAERGLNQFPQSFLLWESVLRLQIVLGNDNATRQRLLKAPFGREGERAAVSALTADLAAERGDLLGAIELYERAAALQPNNAVHQSNLARVTLARFELEDAAAHLQRLSEIQAPTARLRNRSTNASQTFLGQILNEYLIDPAARARFEALPPARDARIAGLLAACRDFPDNTLLSAALVDAVWTSGAFTPKPPAADEETAESISEVPRRIFQYWDEAAPPEDIRDLMESWHEVNADYEYERFDDRAARRFIAQHFDQHVVFAYHRAGTPSAKSDLFRLAYLVQKGGVHADAFDRCTDAIDPLLPGNASLVLYRGELGLLTNGFMGAVPNHPVMRVALDQAVTSINRGDKDLLWLATGPGLINRCVAQYLAAAETPETLAERLASICVWPRREVFFSVALGCLSEWRGTIQPRSNAFTKRFYTIQRPTEAAAG